MCIIIKIYMGVEAVGGSIFGTASWLEGSWGEEGEACDEIGVKGSVKSKSGIGKGKIGDGSSVLRKWGSSINGKLAS